MQTGISFFYETKLRLNDRTLLKTYLRKLFRKEGKLVGNVNYIFCSDEKILEINRQYLNHDYYTDIITFELSEAGQPLEADIYISVDTVRSNAKLMKESFSREIHRVIFHGALHLCGYKDKKISDIKTMREMEEKYLEGYFI